VSEISHPGRLSTLTFATENWYAAAARNVKDFKVLHNESGNQFGIVARTYDDTEDGNVLGQRFMRSIIR